jgi:hypothetical protein
MYARCRAERCAARGEWTRVGAGTRCTLSASTACRRHGQSKGCGGTYGWSGQLAVIGWRRRWPVGVDGEAATAVLPPKPWSPRACARSASARERGRVRCRGCGGWQVGSWGSSWAVARRRLGVGGGGGEREGVGQSLQRLPRAPPLLCVQAQEDKENKRGRERGSRLG